MPSTNKRIKKQGKDIINLINFLLHWVLDGFEELLFLIPFLISQRCFCCFRGLFRNFLINNEPGNYYAFLVASIFNFGLAELGGRKRFYFLWLLKSFLTLDVSYFRYLIARIINSIQWDWQIKKVKEFGGDIDFYEIC